MAPTEIITGEDFFDFSAKYEGKSVEITPARLVECAIKHCEFQQKKSTPFRYESVRAEVILFLLETFPHFLEINTVPGLTEEKFAATASQTRWYIAKGLFGNALLGAHGKINNFAL